VTLQDLMKIFDGNLNLQVFQSLVAHLDAVIGLHGRTLLIRTRNDHGLQLGYFSVVHLGRAKPVIFAGALESRAENERVSAIRFLNTNPELRHIPQSHKFEYRKGDWTNVEVSESTITQLPSLFRSEIDAYLQRYDLS
jgi:hypothetical protein